MSTRLTFERVDIVFGRLISPFVSLPCGVPFPGSRPPRVDNGPMLASALLSLPPESARSLILLIDGMAGSSDRLANDSLLSARGSTQAPTSGSHRACASPSSNPTSSSGLSGKSSLALVGSVLSGNAVWETQPGVRGESPAIAIPPGQAWATDRSYER